MLPTAGARISIPGMEEFENTTLGKNHTIAFPLRKTLKIPICLNSLQFS
jgi:hypothetical protein